MNRTLVWQLAIRYMRGKRGRQSANAVPILSRISMAAIAVASGAMIVLFSVFNGFEVLIKEMYKAFYADIRITPARGKYFPINDPQLQQIKGIQGIEYTTTVLEDNALASGNDQQSFITIKGIDSNYLKVNDIDRYIIEGRDSVSAYPMPTTIVGRNIVNQMGLDVNNVFSRLVLYYPNLDVNPVLNPTEAFSSLQLKPDGVFSVQEEFDSKYVLASLPLVQQLLRQDGKFSSIEIKLQSHADVAAIKAQLQRIMGAGFHIDTRFEQNKTLYLVMMTEKWAIFAILSLVLLIASFNMIGALSLLVLEKQKDMAILKAMGAQPADIRNIFIAEGLLWSFMGGGIGIILGVALCLAQQHFKFIKLEGAFIIDAYPVKMQPMDFLLILATILLVGLLAAWFPAMRATKTEAPTLK